MIDTELIRITHNAQLIALISFGLAVMSALVRNAVLDKDQVKESKEKLKKHQTALKEATKKGDTTGAKRAQEDLMSVTMENFKQSFKPMMFTMIPFLLVFSWLRKTYGGVGTVVGFSGINLGWLGWYIVCSMVASIILNKILKVY